MNKSHRRITYLVGESGPELFLPLNAVNRLYVPQLRARDTADLHDGQWFIDQGKAEARQSTLMAMVLVCTIAVAIGLAFA